MGAALDVPSSSGVRQAAPSRLTLCGVISVSGAGLDLTDQRTWDLGAHLDYYEARFATGGEPNWRTLASPMSFLTPSAPPFLVIRSGGESAPLVRQSEWLAEKLREAEVPVHLAVVPGGSHERIVLALSRDDQTAGPLITQFVHGLVCRER